MKKSVSAIVIADLLFVAFLALSGTFSGILSEIIYYLAFVIPAVFLLLFIKLGKEKTQPPKFTLNKSDALMTLPVSFLTLGIVFLISFITSFLLSMVGAENSTDLSGNILLVILTHALLPSLLEEGLFRYLPLMILTPYSKRSAILISALFFALIHCSLYQIPYAFVAGIIFAFVDIVADSIIPSVIFHFINNLASIIWVRNSSDPTFALVFIIGLSVFALVSVIPVLILRNKYKSAAVEAFSDKSKEKLSFEPIILAVVTLSVAFLSL